MKLFIVESPGKVKKIQGFLGPSYRVMASVGHVRDLPDKETGVEPPDFIPKYEATRRGKEVLAKLSAAAQQAEEIYLATDPDREGEAIAWHLEEALRLKSAKRITYTEITDRAIKEALNKSRDIDRSLVSAQECRRVLDRLVGYMVSPALSSQSGVKLSAGRVQSPAVRLVVERERAIREFKVTAHYGVDLLFEAMEHITEGWKASWLPGEGWLAEGEEYLQDKALAVQVAATGQVLVTDCQETEAKSAPPAPFITSTLQQAASAALQFSPKKSMELAQALYEDGHITYMRTDSLNLSEEAIAEIRSWAAKHDYPLPAVPRTWKHKEGAQEAHEAIRPTHLEAEVAGESADAQALYQMIRLRTLASQLEEAVFSVRTLRLEGESQGKKAVFEARGRTLVQPGWKALVASDQAEEPDEDNEAENQVPKLPVGQGLRVQESQVINKKTRPPARYTEAALVRELEKRGIGRPSTYAAILENITSTHNYIQLEKRSLMPTEKGEKVIEAMSGAFTFCDYSFTKEMEEGLDAIAEGRSRYQPLVARAYNQLRAEIDTYIAATSTKCPECGLPLRHLFRPDTKTKKGYNFWGCSNYPACPATFADAEGVPGDRQDTRSKPAASGFSCPKCGKDLVRRTGTSKTGKPYDFFGCIGFRQGCKATFNPKADNNPDFEGRQGK